MAVLGALQNVPPEFQDINGSCFRRQVLPRKIGCVGEDVIKNEIVTGGEESRRTVQCVIVPLPKQCPSMAYEEDNCVL